MEILYVLIPLSIVLVGLAVAAFIWAASSGQFDDLEDKQHLPDDSGTPSPPVIPSERDRL